MLIRRDGADKPGPAIMKILLTAFALIIVVVGLSVSAALLILPLAVVIVGVAVISRLFDDEPEPALVGEIGRPVPSATAMAGQLSARAA